MILTHYSNVPNLKVLDPKAHGTGLLGAEAKRKRDYPEIYLPRTYFGLKGYQKEFGLGDFAYKLSLPAKSFYDYESDPENLCPGPDVLEAAGYSQFDRAAQVCLYEFRISSAGFEGYIIKGARVAAKFTPTKV